MELLLDAELDASVRALWARLRAAGLPSLATHSHPTNRPHLTLVAAESIAGLPELGLPELGLPGKGLPENGLPENGLPVTLHRVRMLGKALVREVVATPELRALQAAVWQSTDGRNPLHAPGAWLPHISLALNVRADRRAAALSVLGTVPPVSGRLVAARTYDGKLRTVTALAR